MTTVERSEDGEDFPPELIRPEDFMPGEDVPEDARRMGLANRHASEEAALLAFASNLNARNPVHRAVAITLLVAFSLPAVLTVLSLLR